MNNSWLGMVRQWQEFFYQKRYAMSYMESLPDFVKLAEAYGGQLDRYRKLLQAIESERPDVIVEKVTLDNHRGNPMVVRVSRKRTDTGARPAHLNVYPPMGAATVAVPFMMASTIPLLFTA